MKHHKNKIEDHCIVLLKYIAKNHSKDQYLRSLSDATEIPLGSLYHIINDAKNSRHAPLYMWAHKYRYIVTIYNDDNPHDPHEEKMLLDVVNIGDGSFIPEEYQMQHAIKSYCYKR